MNGSSAPGTSPVPSSAGPPSPPGRPTSSSAPVPPSPPFPPRTANRLAAALVLAIAFASVGVVLSPIDPGLVEPYRLSGQVLVWHWERLFAPFINIYALFVLVGGALWSAWKF